MQVAKTGYGKSNPAYEEYYEKGIPVGTPSLLGVGWVYPRCSARATRGCSSARARWAAGLRDAPRARVAGRRVYHRVSDPRETRNGETVNPRAKLPWATPWRVVVVGSLKTIVESTLGTDVADPPANPADATVKPGKAAWTGRCSVIRLRISRRRKKFIDYAADMGWAYVLIDAWWDKQIGTRR